MRNVPGELPSAAFAKSGSMIWVGVFDPLSVGTSGRTYPVDGSNMFSSYRNVS